MKEYHSIDGSKNAPIGQYCYVEQKLDGSNLRGSWSRKRGWHQFGTRRTLIDAKNPEYGVAIDLFLKKYGDNLAKAIYDYKDFKKPIEATAFFEFFGPHSFAGWHNPVELSKLPDIKIDNNDPKDVVLFDVNIYKRGIVGPRNFYNAFGHLPVVELLYQGELTEEFVKEIKEEYSGEGVVIKWGDGFHHTLGMCKIKTNAYLERLKRTFGVGGWQQFWE